MEKFVALVLNGAVFGSLYSLVAAGLVVTYTTSKMFNFGHGAVAFATALLYYELNTGLGWPIVPAAVVAVVIFAPAFGLLVNRLVFRPLVQADESSKIVATVGLLVAVPALALWIVERLRETFGFEIAPTDNIVTVAGLGPQPKRVWELGSVLRVDSTQVIVLALAVVSAVSLWLLLRHTRLGLQMRAAVDRPDLAEARGVDGNRVTGLAWALGFLLAGLAGVAGAPILSLFPSSYDSLLFVGATAAILGRLRSVPLALLGGLLLGVAQNLVAGYATFAAGITGFSTSVPFFFLLAGLVVLGWDRARVAGQATEGGSPIAPADDLPAWRRVLPRALAVIVLMWFTFIVADRFWVGLIVQGLAYAIVFLSFVVVTGLGRMVSLAQAAFVTAAAMTTGLLLSHGASFGLAAALGVVAAVAAGLVVALPALRLGGLFLSLATLSLAFLGDRVLFAWDSFRNGASGWRIDRPAIGPLDLGEDRAFALFLMVVLALVSLLVHNLRRSRAGRAIVSVQSSAPAAASVGLSVVRSRLVVFAASAAIAGLGGILLASANRSISHTSFPPLMGLVWLLVVVLFGVSRIEGAIIAGLVLAVSGEIIGWFSHSAYIPSILFGLGAIQLATAPDGIVVLATQQLRALRQRVTERPARAPTADGLRPARPEARPAAVASANGQGTTPALEVRGLHAGYGDVEVLHGIDLALEPGTVTAVLGVNGAGKSTLCRVLAGLHPPGSGVVEMDGEDVTRLPAHERARRGFFLAPESRGIFPELTVDENLRLSLGRTGDVDVAYDRFPHLAERRGIPASNLSGGEQQMLTLAPVLIRVPHLMVADEPSLGLAPLIVSTVIDIFGELRAEGTTVLLVEEKPRHVLTLADQVAVLELGRIAWSGPVSAVDAERVAATYLHQEAAM